MTSRELLYVKTIADEKSITKAAQKLYLTQPSLSHCVIRIEEQLGVKLFKRTTDGLLLTYAGERYYQLACHILRVYNEFEVEINDINKLEKGRITFGITNYLATYLLPSVLPKFHALHPGVELKIIEETSTDMERSLLAGKLDFVIMHANPDAGSAKNSQLQFWEFGKTPFILVAPPDNPYRDQAVDIGRQYPMLDLKLLKDEKFMMVSRGQRIRQMSDYILSSAGIEPDILLVSKSYETLRRLAAAGMGYTLVPQEYTEIFHSDPQPVYFSIDPAYNPYWSLVAAICNNNYLSMASRAFIDLMGAHYGMDRGAVFAGAGEQPAGEK